MRRAIQRSPRWMVLAVLVLLAGFPTYWMLVTALTDSDGLFASTPRIFPTVGEVGNIIHSLTGGTPIGRWLLNSFLIASGTTVGSLLMGIPAAYALSRFRFRGGALIGLVMFVTQMLPEALLVVPLYTIFVHLGLVNSLVPVILGDIAFAMPVAVWILKSGMDDVPSEIEEAARIDGCSRLVVLTRVVVPLVKPSVAAAAVIAFFAGWNEYLFALRFLTDEAKWPASVGLASFIGEYQTPLNLVMSAALVFALPAILFFLLVQKHIVSGLTSGAVKG